MKRVHWDEWELMFLEEAYKQGYPLKSIATFLNRTLSSVNKALIRQYIRVQHQEERKLKGRVIATHDAVDIIQNKVREKGYDIPIKEIPKNYFTQSMDIFSLLRSEIIYEPGEGININIEKDIKRENAPKKQDLVYFHTIDIILEWLQKQGFSVRKMPTRYMGPYQRSGHKGPWFEISMSGLLKRTPLILKSQSQLLLFVNKLRLKKALPPYYLRDVTEG